MISPLDRRLAAVKWGNFKITDIFEVKNTRCILSNEITPDSGLVPYLCASAENNAVSSFISYRSELIERGNCIFIGGKTFVVTYQEKDFFSNDSHNLVLYLKDSLMATKPHLLFIASCINRSLGGKYTWGNSISHSKIKEDSITLPVTSTDTIDFTFMEEFMRELEEERIRELSTYLMVNGLDNCELSISERKALEELEEIKWSSFNIKTLFGPSTRGKRLKSDDRIPGELPFVTAGEAETGVSAFIGNNVEVFKRNTTTIDMFGSAKYRNYTYGADDHVAVVHTEKIPDHAAVFVTAACHKAAHTGAFDYGRNFYAKDADALSIMLPTLADETPDYELMEHFILAVQKLVIQEMVAWKDRELAAPHQVVGIETSTSKSPLILPEVAPALRFREFLPLYSMQAACGRFGEGEAVECDGWVKVAGQKLDESMFIVRACGRSMEPKINDGDLCIMRAGVAGTRQGKIVLAQHRFVSDPETGGSYSIKCYSSEKQLFDDGSWSHERITLSPFNLDYPPIVLDHNEGDYCIVAELVRILHGEDNA